MTWNTKKAFTLIELLIVVAIIAILAAIAVPNFLEAQTRAKVSRAKADMRTQATAIESYVVDWNKLPRDSDSDLDRETAFASYAYTSLANGAVQLTTPVGYMSSLLSDPFAVGTAASASFGAAIGYRIGSGTWSYGSSEGPQFGTEGAADAQTGFATMTAKGPVLAYVLMSTAPDKVRARMSYKAFPFKPVTNESTSASPLGTGNLPFFYEDYDPTNGSISGGDIYRLGGQYLSGDFDRNAIGAGPSGPDSK